MNRSIHLCFLLALTRSTIAGGSTLRGGHIASKNEARAHKDMVNDSRRRLSTTIPAKEDATLRSGTPYTNYGHDDDLQFMSSPTSTTSGDKAETLLKFDLSGIDATSSQKAILRLLTGDHCDFSSLSNSLQLGFLQIGLAENVVSAGAEGSDWNERWEWNEDTVTWYNSPLLREDGQIVKPLGDFVGRTWLEIDVSSLISSAQTPTVTLRLSSVLFAYSDDNLSLCTFASRDYREGSYAPSLVLGLGPQDAESNVDEDMTVQSSSLVQDQTVEQPYKIFHTPMLMTATTQIITDCAPPYSSTSTYVSGSVVSSYDSNYRCRPYPYTQWCSSKEYEPGVSLFWGLAWDLVNACKSEVQSIHEKESALDTSYKEPTTFSDTDAMVSNAEEVPTSNSPLCPAEWNLVYPYKTGDRVTLPTTMTIYECKEEPFGHFCGDEAYEVGLEGGIWENAWKVVGKCVNGYVLEDKNYLDGKTNTALVTPGQLETSSKCNICYTGQFGIRDDISQVLSCMDAYEYSLQHYLEGTDKCVEAQNKWNDKCCVSEGATTTEATSTEATSASILSTSTIAKTTMQCNLCRPGQVGINADIPVKDGIAKCMDVYEHYVQTYLEGSNQCVAAQDWLNSVCCGDESAMNIDATSISSSTTTTAATTTATTIQVTPSPTPSPITPEPTPAPFEVVQGGDAVDSANFSDEGSDVPDCATQFANNGKKADGSSYSLNDRVSMSGGNYVCMMSQWCSLPDFQPVVGQYWNVVWEYEGSCMDSDESSGGSDAATVRPQRPTGSITSQPTPSPTPSPVAPVTAGSITSQPTPFPISSPVASVATEDEVSVSESNEDPSTTTVPTDAGNSDSEGVAESVTTTPTDAGNSDSEALVEGSDPQCPPSWKLNSPYVEGDTVQAQGQIYACKGFPYTGWCGLEGYEPIVGSFWDSAWDVGVVCLGGDTKQPTAAPTSSAPISSSPTTPPATRDPSTPTAEIEAPSNSTAEIPENDKDTVDKVFAILEEMKDDIDGTLFLYQGSEPSTVYRYDGFVAGLKVMTDAGVAGKFYYLGDDSENGYKYGLANLAAFIGQSMKETIQYDACDENSWDLVDGKYPLSNACGQLGQNYQEYHCSEEEKHMECAVDPNMSIKGVTHAKWYGAPGPMFCGPKTEYPFTGYWDYGYGCNNPWAEPPEYCEDYEGQQAGRYDNTAPVASVGGRTDVEGCCWWGRGVIQTTGICNFGKLNYFLGARAAEEGREARYPDVDFCKDPEVICASQEHQELKWIAGMFYWVESLQSYNERGWNYFTELHEFVDGGMTDSTFINGVSGIVNRGCHDPPCGTGEVDGLLERAGNFEKALQLFMS